MASLGLRRILRRTKVAFHRNVKKQPNQARWTKKQRTKLVKKLAKLLKERY